MDASSITEALNNIDIEDLPYVEKDLSFYELVSLGFLLYGDERPHAAFALQKLLVISNATAATPLSEVPKDLLRAYAANVNKTNWRGYIVEALAVINARRVLRKLGFKWETICLHYLPHVTEITLHIHPLLKALYKICENMTSAEAGRLILHMDNEFRCPGEHLRFYDNTCLEVFLLNWISRRIICIGDHRAKGTNLNILYEYFKLNDFDDLSTILTATLKHISISENSQITDANSSLLKRQEDPKVFENKCPYTNSNVNHINNSFELDNSYNVRYQNAGVVLIINQREFYEETDPDLKHLLPKAKLKHREGTDFDRDIIQQAFSRHGYIPKVHENLSHIDLLHCIRETAKRSERYDSLVVCILSHGFNGVVCGSNSIPVEIAEIEEIFAMDGLRGKPKLLIVQACQTDQGNSIGSEKRKNDPTKYADVLKVMSTVPGFFSLRNTARGSWFIQALGDIIIRYGNDLNLCEILTKVNSKVSEMRGNNFDDLMLPVYMSTLLRQFYLPKNREMK